MFRDISHFNGFGFAWDQLILADQAERLIGSFGVNFGVNLDVTETCIRHIDLRHGCRVEI